LSLAATALFLSFAVQDGDRVPLVEDAPLQPLRVHVGRLREALEFLGEPLRGSQAEKLEAALLEADEAKAVRGIQDVLDPMCLVGVHINPESRVKVAPGAAPRRLVDQGWRPFLIKVHNEAGVTAPLRASSPQALPVFDSPKDEIEDRWMELGMFHDRPLQDTLSGAKLEYRIVQIYSRDAGKRAAVVSFDVGQGTQDLGFRSDVTLTFDAEPSVPVLLQVLDVDGTPTTAGFEIRDLLGRPFPPQAKRRRPDFASHSQLIKELSRLPQGHCYIIYCTRGPEYLVRGMNPFTVGGKPALPAFNFSLVRGVSSWKLGWWSGDHLLHAAGCKHYKEPRERAYPPDLLRHSMGEDSKVAATLQRAFSSFKPEEYIVDVTHETPGSEAKLMPAPLSGEAYRIHLWYQTLNAGFRTRISGETCSVHGEGAGLARSYVKLDGKPDDRLWCEGLRAGRAYVSTGWSHILDFAVNGAEMDTKGSEVRLDTPGKVTVSAKVAALLKDAPIVGPGDVTVEVVVNAHWAGSKSVRADGATREVSFEVPIHRSSWVALRTAREDSHTNPIFILVGGKPVRASRRSVLWCLDEVDRWWLLKERMSTPTEKEAAAAAYDHARRVYRKLLGECEAD